MSNSNKLELSPVQQEIIDSPIEKDILVNAGAGSGKTFVLKSKIAKHLANKDITPSELLVLTFTNNAAHDMKEKIIEEVNNIEGGKVTPQELDNIKNAINSAHIQTFDSFAQEIVVFYADKLNLPKSIFIADNFVLEAKKTELVDKLFDSKYQKEDKQFIEFITKYNMRDDLKTKQVVLDLYTQLEKLSPLQYAGTIKTIESNFDNEAFFKECWDEFGKLWIEKETKKILKESKVKDKDAAIAKLATKLEIERGDYKEEFKKYSSQKESALYLLYLCSELKDMMDEYKKESNCYTFGDIAKKALFLLQNNPDIAEEVRNRYKYIMVDEYQDTNDIQEEVIKILTANKKDGTRNYLFCVGDAKQSIYRFRDANVKIFTDKEAKLSKINQTNPNRAQVIPMYYNYRSFKEVLDQINTIFDSYMTIEHGGIKYNNLSQRLQLPKNHLTWTQEYFASLKINKPAEFGLHIITTNEPKDLINYYADDEKRWECRQIINDIKHKIDSHFQVWDEKENRFRNCEYRDFFILSRTKSNFAIYEDEFKKAGISLNNEIGTNLVEVNPIMLINSIIKYLALKENNDNSQRAFEQKKHIFASIARSYITKGIAFVSDNGEMITITDQDIFDSISDGSFINSPILKMLDALYDLNKDVPFSKLFNSIINNFGINKLLFRVGEVEKNAAKIESLYKFILSIEQSKGGISSFAQLLEIISKHRIELEDKAITDMDNAVSLMTIHQSKGLQKQIVYLPNSVNHLGGSSGFATPEYIFDKHYGILLPDYDINDYRTSKDFKEFYPKGSCIYTIPYKTCCLVNKQNKEDINEHVRLFYVALTRAQQAIYIVGYPKCKLVDKKYEMNETKNKETLFDMLSCVWGDNLFPYENEKAFPLNNWHKVSDIKLEKAKKKQLEISNISDEELIFPIRKHLKASQLPIIIDTDIVEQRINAGNELHKIMENINFNNPDLSFINNKTYKLIVEKVINMNLFKQTLKNADFKPEFEFYDVLFHTHESIDLLAIKDGVYYIIDYKLWDTSKQEYEKQMHIYQRNIQHIFKIDKSKINLILISLNEAKEHNVPLE